MKGARDPAPQQCSCGKNYFGSDDDPCPRCGGGWLDVPSLDSLQVVIDPNVSLTRTNEHGETVEALCWEIYGVLHVHPDRWKQYFEPLTSKKT